MPGDGEEVEAIEESVVERQICDVCGEAFELGVDTGNSNIVFCCGCEGCIPAPQFVQALEDRYDLGEDGEEGSRRMYQ